jgi:hypothetical protein
MIVRYIAANVKNHKPAHDIFYNKEASGDEKMSSASSLSGRAYSGKISQADQVG